MSSRRRILYAYDSSDNIIGLSYRGKDYFYIKNLQNDIIGIVDSNGILVVEYKYSPYGLTTISSDTSKIELGAINPFRFKSYYYDNWTGFYYCNSRYYNPKIGRWINADDINYLDPSSISETNLFAYCGNNPISNLDSNGNFILTAILLTKIAVALVATYVAYYTVDVTLPTVSAAVDSLIDEIGYSGKKLDNVSESTKEAAVAIETDHTREHENDYNVYLLLDNASGDVFYVGITKNIEARKKYHKSTKATPHRMVVVTPNISLAEARILETSLIIQYGTLNRDNKDANHIFSVNKACIDFDLLMGKVESDALLILGI